MLSIHIGCLSMVPAYDVITGLNDSAYSTAMGAMERVKNIFIVFPHPRKRLHLDLHKLYYNLVTRKARMETSNLDDLYLRGQV
jgi:hypothetical protein